MARSLLDTQRALFGPRRNGPDVTGYPAGVPFVIEQGRNPTDEPFTGVNLTPDFERQRAVAAFETSTQLRSPTYRGAGRLPAFDGLADLLDLYSTFPVTPGIYHQTQPFPGDTADDVLLEVGLALTCAAQSVIVTGPGDAGPWPFINDSSDKGSERTAVLTTTEHRPLLKAIAAGDAWIDVVTVATRSTPSSTTAGIFEANLSVYYDDTPAPDPEPEDIPWPTRPVRIYPRHR